jgi:hypothetical protein
MSLKNSLPTSSDSVMGFDLGKTILPMANYKMYPTEITVCSFDEDLLSWEMIDDTNTSAAKKWQMVIDVAEIKDELTRGIGMNNVAVLRGGEEKGHNDNDNNNNEDDVTHTNDNEYCGVTIVAVLRGGEEKGHNDNDNNNSNNEDDVTHTNDNEYCGVTIVESDSDTYISGIFSLPVDNTLPSAPRTILPIITTVVANNTSKICSFPSCNVEDTDCHCAFCTCYDTEDTDPCQCAVCTIQ